SLSTTSTRSMRCSSRAGHSRIVRHTTASSTSNSAPSSQAYPLSWVSSERSLAALERARRVVEQHTDPSVRTRVRARCASARIWVAGWDPQAAEEVCNAHAELGMVEDCAVRAQHLSDYSTVQWASYDIARRSGAPPKASLWRASSRTAG